MNITTHLADDRDPNLTACGIPMPVPNRANNLRDTAVFCTGCRIVALHGGNLMYNYRLLNANGKVLGILCLETEDLPQLLINGEKLILSGSYADGSKKFINFFVTPEVVPSLVGRNIEEFERELTLDERRIRRTEHD